jgi:hypothetical protein
VDLNDALKRFDAVETNLVRLDKVIEDYEALIPPGISFASGSPEGIRADELQAAFGDLVASLPPIDGWTIDAMLVDLDDIAQARLDAAEISEPQIEIDLHRQLSEPARQVAEYRRRFSKLRRALVRDRARELLSEVDDSLSAAASAVARDGAVVDHNEWERFKSAFEELERLLGSSVMQKGRWTDLKRHLSFGQGVDLHDIVDHDWPSVRPHIVEGLYGQLEPIPVELPDLATVVAQRPSGPVTTKLAWETLTAEDFERLIFNLLASTPSYENVTWEMRTNAPDRGRDIAAYRVAEDPLSGVQRRRVAVQCKHWLTKSVGPNEVASEVASIKLWDNPPVDVLIIATSGRFTMDAVSWIEKHNSNREHPAIEQWAESHLESLLAQRPNLVAEFNLRPE